VTTDNVTTYAYDDAGNLYRTETGHSASGDMLFTRTQYNYDALNRLTDEMVNKVDTTGGSEALTPIAEFNYNADSMPLAADGQREGVIETRYDAAGNLYSTTVIDWTYDNLNRLIGEDFDQDLASISGNESTNDYTDAYTLDEVGNRLTKTHDAGRHGTIDQTTTSSYTTNSGLMTC
jgi:hypothetical protein